jgi:hypothetical protein
VEREADISSTVVGMPRATRQATAASPDGPVPTMRTSGIHAALAKDEYAYLIINVDNKVK